MKIPDVRASLVSGRICLTFYTLPITALTTLGNYLVLLCFSQLWARLPKPRRLSLLKHPIIKRLSQSLSQILEASALASASPSCAGSKTFSLFNQRQPWTSRKSRNVLSLTKYFHDIVDCNNSTIARDGLYLCI